MDTSQPLIIDRMMPRYDATQCDLRIVNAPTDAVYAAVRNLDFLEISTPMIDAAMWVRQLPAKLRTKSGEEKPAAPPPTMRLAAMFDTPDHNQMEGWIPLGESPGREIVFGAVGAFWEADIPWKTIDPASFTDFAEPGLAKIAASFTVLPFGDSRTVLAYEARTVGTDEAATAKFLRYWRLVHRFVGLIMRAALKTIGTRAERHVPDGV